MKAKVMSAKGLISSFSVFYGALIMIVLNPAGVSTTLCESRCKSAMPFLRQLTLIWRQSSEDETFTFFVRRLIYASHKYSEFEPLKRGLINMVAEYKDCVKACEHQHSKRSAPQIYRSDTPSHRCLTPYLCL